MKKNQFLLLSIVLFGCLSQLCAQQKKYNVLLIMVDDLRNELGCYGSKAVKTPNLDALAKDALVFNNAYCQQAVCSPSRTSLLTGLRPDVTRVYNLITHFRSVMPDVVTLPQYFMEQGYYTKGIGKIYHKGLEDPYSWTDEKNNPEKIAKLDGVLKRISEGKTYKPRSRPDSAYGGLDVEDDYYEDGQFCNEALKAIRERSKASSPFFLAVGFKKPHLPFLSPRKYWNMYSNDEIEVAANDFQPECMPEVAFAGPGELRLYQGIPDTGRLVGETAKLIRHGYYACVSYVDAQIGKLVNELKKNGLYENTIILVVGDHGWKLGEHDMWGKHTNFELDTRVPLIVRAPDKPVKGRSTDAMVELIDIYPSLCELAGIPLPKDTLAGTSFQPLLKKKNQKHKEAAYSQYPRPGNIMGYSMRTDKYRLTQWFHKRSEIVATELYDHQKDHEENKNLACEPKYQKLIAELTAQMRRDMKLDANDKKK